MDPDGFLKALGEFPADKTGAPVKALVELWNGEMTRAVDTIAPKHPLPPGRAHSSPWYTPELRVMKQAGRRLEPELFRVVQGLVCPGPKKDLVPPSKARCDDFAKHFREKIAQIRHELDSTSDSEVSGETPMLLSGPKLMDEFQLLWPNDVDKEVVVQLVLKKASLDSEMATNYRPVANILFLGKVLERVVVGQLQALLNETDYLDPFQSGFRPGYGTESALVALYDDLCREKDRGSASLLVLLDLSAAFDTIDHGEAVAVLNWCLAEVMGWMRANKLKLSPDKTEVLLVGGSGFGEGELNLVLNGVALPLRGKVCSLGVLLNPELSLEAQVTAVARSAFLQLRLIHQLRPYLEYDCLATVTHALVTSCLDF
ncbi:RNA-directed DNA polymerase from mobile element jockey [Varanus komodoensis]|nr:RNA-directed DNA polymerase from mobile element jockey [Varanus komodoensis]